MMHINGILLASLKQDLWHNIVHNIELLYYFKPQSLTNNGQCRIISLPCSSHTRVHALISARNILNDEHLCDDEWSSRVDQPVSGIVQSHSILPPQHFGELIGASEAVKRDVSA